MTEPTRWVWQVAIIWLSIAGANSAAEQKAPSVLEPSSGSQAQGSHLPKGDHPREVGRTPLPHDDSQYRIQVGDSLELTFVLTPEFSQTVIVRPDGYITLRGREDMKVDGLTTPELRQKLHQAYAGLLREPVITVDLKDFERVSFVVFGEVMKPGKYELRGDTRLTQALAIAGGFNESAKHSQVLLVRGVSDELLGVKTFNVKQLLRQDRIGEDVLLRPGDMVFVPRTFLSKIRDLIPRAGMGLYLRPTF